MRAATIILNGFAALWASLALSAAHAPGWALALPLAVSAALTVALWPTVSVEVRSPQEGRRIGRLVGWASLVEGAAILAGVTWLGRLGHGDLAVCWVAAVVGLHFLPLARWIPAPVYAFTAVGMIGAALVGLALPADVRGLAVGGGAAGVLWATALSFFRSRPPRLAGVS